MMKKLLFTFCLLASMATMVQAQFSQFHVGLAFPSGKFADGEYINDITYSGKGAASTGFTIGYKYYSPLAVQHLSFVFGIEAYYNGLNSDAKDDLEEGFDDVAFPMYFNFPVTVGLNYALPLQENIKLYGEAAIGGNFSMPTKADLSDSDNYQDMSISFTPLFGFAYGLEGGIFIGNKYSVGLRYNNLGSYKFKYETDYETKTTDKDKFNKTLPIVNLSLCAGILF
jgi:hypothetical protein